MACFRHSADLGHGGFGRGGREGGPGGHPGMGSAAAATFLGLTEAELRTQLMAGKSLADIAKAQGKTVAGLKAALAADTKKKLDAAVKAGRLTQAQEDEALKRMNERLDDAVNGKGFEGGHRGRHGWGGPPPGAGTPPASTFPRIPSGSAI